MADRSALPSPSSLSRAVTYLATTRTDETRCPHTTRSDDALCVLPAKPRGSHYVRCPCCGLSGWQMDDDEPAMVCPDCLVTAETVAS